MSSTGIMGNGVAVRVAGQTVIEELLRLRENAKQRSAVARVLGVSPLSHEERTRYLGALGETITSRMLSRLPDDWIVLHEVPIGTGGADVDHFVVGPGGVFALTAAHTLGQSVVVSGRTLTIGGNPVDHLRRSEYGAERATITLSRILPPEVDVLPVIAFVHPKSITIASASRAARAAVAKVIDAQGVVPWLRQRPVVLTGNQIALIAMTAADPATWHSQRALSAASNACGPVATGPISIAPVSTAPAPASLTQRFTELDRQVRIARRTRLVWIVAGGAAILSTLVVVVPVVGELLSALLR